MKKLFYILSSLFLLVSCGPTELTEDEKNDFDKKPSIEWSNLLY